MKNIRIFLSENFPFLVVKFSIYLNRSVFVMDWRFSHFDAHINQVALSENVSYAICEDSKPYT